MTLIWSGVAELAFTGGIRQSLNVGMPTFSLSPNAYLVWQIICRPHRVIGTSYHNADGTIQPYDDNPVHDGPLFGSPYYFRDCFVANAPIGGGSISVTYDTTPAFGSPTAPDFRAMVSVAIVDFATPHVYFAQDITSQAGLQGNFDGTVESDEMGLSMVGMFANIRAHPTTPDWIPVAGGFSTLSGFNGDLDVEVAAMVGRFAALTPCYWAPDVTTTSLFESVNFRFFVAAPTPPLNPYPPLSASLCATSPTVAVSATASTAPTAGRSASVTIPTTVQDGDLMVLLVGVLDDTASPPSITSLPSVVSGWTRETWQNRDGAFVDAWTRVANGSDPGSIVNYVISSSAGTQTNPIISTMLYAMRNVQPPASSAVLGSTIDSAHAVTSQSTGMASLAGVTEQWFVMSVVEALGGAFTSTPGGSGGLIVTPDRSLAYAGANRYGNFLASRASQPGSATDYTLVNSAAADLATVGVAVTPRAPTASGIYLPPFGGPYTLVQFTTSGVMQSGSTIEFPSTTTASIDTFGSSVDAYDWTNAAFSIQFGPVGSPYKNFYMLWYAYNSYSDPNRLLGIDDSGHLVVMSFSPFTVLADAGVFDPLIHQYMGIVTSGGTIIYRVSTDGVTWTTIYSEALPAGMDYCSLQILNYVFNGVTLLQGGTWDIFQILSDCPPNSGSRARTRLL